MRASKANYDFHLESARYIVKAAKARGTAMVTIAVRGRCLFGLCGPAGEFVADQEDGTTLRVFEVAKIEKWINSRRSTIKPPRIVPTPKQSPLERRFRDEQT